MISISWLTWANLRVHGASLFAESSSQRFSLMATTCEYSHFVPWLMHSWTIAGSSHHHLSASTKRPQTSCHSIRAVRDRSSSLTAESRSSPSRLAGTGTATTLTEAIELPFPRRRATASHVGKALLGSVVRNDRSRCTSRCLKSHARSFGPVLELTGCGSIRVRCREPPGTRHLLSWRRRAGISLVGNNEGRETQVIAA